MLHWLQHMDFALNGWARGLGWPAEAFFRLGLAAIAGGLVGLEREVRGRQAGFRTYLLVCVGSALVMLVSISFATPGLWQATPGFNIRIDPARIAYGVMMGIGFLGAGTIIHSAGSIHGLTTSAALWCIAAVGLSVGFGLYSISAAAVVVVLLALWILDYVEKIIPKVHYRLLTIRQHWEPGCIDQTMKMCQEAGVRLSDVSFRRTEDLTSIDLDLRLAVTSQRQFRDFQRRIEQDQRYILIAAREL